MFFFYKKTTTTEDEEEEMKASNLFGQKNADATGGPAAGHSAGVKRTTLTLLVTNGAISKHLFVNTKPSLLIISLFANSRRRPTSRTSSPSTSHSRPKQTARSRSFWRFNNSWNLMTKKGLPPRLLVPRMILVLFLTCLPELVERYLHWTIYYPLPPEPVE